MPAGRFDNILKGAPSAPVYDTLLWDLGEVVVTPTLGSIIPHWVLAIPRDPAVNIVRWSKDPQKPLRFVSQIAHVAGYEPEQVLWFEHGAPSIGAITGCGVDHAHLHLLLRPPFSFEEFKAASRAAARINWQEGTGNPYEALRPDGSYLVAGSSNQYLLAKDAESVGTQFFRRIVASLTGVPNSWDYQRHPHLQNVKVTLARAKAA
jgi:ATP adenylyltransferase